ncbi:hypothetical protein [Phormidium nigroviride]
MVEKAGNFLSAIALIDAIALNFFREPHRVIPNPVYYPLYCHCSLCEAIAETRRLLRTANNDGLLLIQTIAIY